MTYSVKYRLKGQWFWRRVKRVKGDLVPNDLGVVSRVLILENEERIEIPMEGTEFRFSTERFLVIKQSMEKQTNSPIITDSRVK